MPDLAARSDEFSAPQLAGYAAIKLVALVVAGTCGFRGGRIFPAVFVAVAMGLAINAAVPAVPQAVAVGASLLGVLLAVSRSGWLSPFMAVLIVGDPGLLPLLCVIILPAWLVVTGRPEMEVAPDPAPTGAGTVAADPAHAPH